MSPLSLAKSLKLNRPGVYIVKGAAPEHAIDALHFFQSCSGSIASKIDDLSPGKGCYAFGGFGAFDKPLWEQLEWLFSMCEKANLKFIFYMTVDEFNGIPLTNHPYSILSVKSWPHFVNKDIPVPIYR